MYNFLASLAMTPFRPRIETIIFPTPSRCATCNPTDADHGMFPYITTEIKKSNNFDIKVPVKDFLSMPF